MYNAIAKKESAFHHFGGESKAGGVHETSSETAFVHEDGFGQMGIQKAAHKKEEEKHRARDSKTGEANQTRM